MKAFSTANLAPASMLDISSLTWRSPASMTALGANWASCASATARSVACGCTETIGQTLCCQDPDINSIKRSKAGWRSANSDAETADEVQP